MSDGRRSPTTNRVPVMLIELSLERGATFEQELPASYGGLVYVIDGALRAGSDDMPIERGQLGWLEHGEETASTTLRFVGGDHGARAVLYAGEPPASRISDPAHLGAAPLRSIVIGLAPRIGLGATTISTQVPAPG